MFTLGALLAAIGISLGVGAGGVLVGQGVHARRAQEQAQAQAQSIQATADVAEAVATGVADATREALSPLVLEANTSRDLANAPYVNLLVEAAAKPGATPAAVTLAAYGIAVSQTQGGKDSAAFAVSDRSEDLSAAVAAMIQAATPQPCSCPDEKPPE